MFPKLRFKEFDGDWEKTTIGAKSETVTSGSRDWAQYYSDSGDKFIRMTNLVRNGINLDLSDLRFVQLPVGSNEGKRTSLEKGDILISITAELGKLGWIPEGLGTAYINQHTALVRMKNTLDSKFVAYALSTEKYNNKLNSLNDSGAKAGLNLGTIRSFELTIPSKPEQTQIASFLSVVDEKISQLTQKLELLSQYKQGMMQKLFSQQIRFRADDGSEFGEWASEKISKVFTNKSKSFNPLLNESLPCIELEHLSQNTGQILGTVNSSDQQSTKNLFEPNSVLYGKLRPYLRKFAKPQFKGVCSSEIWVLTGLKISNDYLFQFVQSEQFTELTNIQSGSKMPRADWNVIADAEIEFPCLGEQTKIANFLSSIDQKIEVVAQQIEQAKQWKKGLLQQMFI